LTPKSSLGASVLLQTHSDDSGNINDYDQWSGNLGYAYRFSKNWSLSVAYNLDIREGNDPLQDFSEDRI
jgi:predicted porin